VSQRRVLAPAAGLVQDTFFLQGEWVPAGRPVASLLPPGNTKVRFFVPEPVLGTVQPGDTVRVACDGCPAPLSARIVFISRQAEFTPPVLYSRGSREKLVYMVEARPPLEDAARLRPGQPVDVTLESAPAPR
jgi:HlyD family secretion protein